MPAPFRCLVLWLCCFAAAHSPAATQQQMRDPEIRAIYDQGCAAYFGRRDRAEGMRLFKELEALAMQKGNNYWHAIAYWKQAQILGDEGNQTASIALFEKCLATFKRDDDFVGTANHLILLENLYSNYESRGQRGESRRIHQDFIIAAGLNLSRTSKQPADTPLFDLSDEQLAAVTNMAFIGFLYSTEIRQRFEAGDNAGALDLAFKVHRRFTGTTQRREITVHGLVLETISRIHLATGRDDDAEIVLRTILALPDVQKTEAFDEELTARVDLALLRCRHGDDAGPWIDYANVAMEKARARGWVRLRLSGTGKIARMLAIQGNREAGMRTLNEAIQEARTLDEPLLLAELLLARAELSLDAGITQGVQKDLYETLKWCRQQGGLRVEATAFVQHARLLRLQGDDTEAQRAVTRAQTLIQRFPDVRLARALQQEPRPAPTNPPVAVNPQGQQIADLQPVERTTRIASSWTAKGRFLVTNPGKDIVEGLLEVHGLGLAASWDQAGLQLNVSSTEDKTSPPVRQRISLKPLDQAIILLTVPPSAAPDGRIRITWRDEGEAQTAWWVIAPESQLPDLAVIDANLALENPFYSVPLHHYVVRANPDSGTSQNVRVLTSVPCRVEIVNALTGKVLAVDATGDGDFRGVGDVIFADGNLDGLPDFRYDKGQRVAEVEIQVYPQASAESIDIRMELQKRDGTWMPSATDRLIGKQ